MPLDFAQKAFVPSLPIYPNGKNQEIWEWKYEFPLWLRLKFGPAQILTIERSEGLKLFSSQLWARRQLKSLSEVGMWAGIRV